MSVQTKTIGFFKQKIISYYDELILKIDIKTEEFLSHKVLESHEIEEINTRRSEWIKKIELVRKQNVFDLETNTNLEILNLLKFDEEWLNSILFKNGYVIFTQHKADKDDDPLFIGQLIYKNGYLNKNVIEKFE